MSVNVGQRNIPDTPQTKQCYAVDACMEFALHTQKICKNHKIFTDDYKELRDKIIDTAINSNIASYDANKIKAISQSEKEKRLKLQIAAINSCISMMGFISWKSFASEGNSKKLLQRMDKYYKSLWR